MSNRNKVYYGEYSLKHWIDLIMTKDIELPEYQRFFVWSKKQTGELLNSLMENQFVPPVTIGNYILGGKKAHLILDGQQRLTSILLAYFEVFPERNKYKIIKDEHTANENDDNFKEDEIDEDEYYEVDFIEWNFNKMLEQIQKKGLRDKNKIHDELIKVGYENMPFESLTEEVIEDCYLGFSFIVPDTIDDKEQQRFYSKVFRSINTAGTQLQALESRQALYYLNQDYVGLFAPGFAKFCRTPSGRMDFVRYLAILSQYKKNNGESNLARGYARYMEAYYEKFIYSVVDEKSDTEFVKLSNVIPQMDYKERIEKLSHIMEIMGLDDKEHPSIIDMDLYMFGIIYFVLFEGKEVIVECSDNLKSNIEEKIKNIKEDKTDRHTKNPGALKYLKIRLKSSIDIYERYVR